jgi:hypothetical protein
VGPAEGVVCRPTDITTVGSARDLKATLFTTCRDAPDAPFLDERFPGEYALRRSTDGTPYYTVVSAGQPVASYEGQTLIVDRKHRRRGVGFELVIALRSEHPALLPATHRTPHAHTLQQRAHEAIVRRALLRREAVPAAVIADYPQFRRLARSATAASADRALGAAEDAATMSPRSGLVPPSAEFARRR